MNGIWVRALPGPMHLGLRTVPLKKVKLLLCHQLVLYSNYVVFMLKMIHFKYIKVSIFNPKAHPRADNSVHQTVCILPNARSSNFKLYVHYTALTYQIVLTIQVSINSLTLRRLMSYIYGAPILDVSRSHTTTQHSR